MVPYWLVERALLKKRERWPVTKLNNVAINRKYSTHWQNIIQKAYPGWPGITARAIRRFFAVYAYSYFGNSIFTEASSQSSLIAFSSWMLGHATLDGQAISYQSLVIRPEPRLKLLDLGRELKVNSPVTEKKIKTIATA